MTRVRGPLKTAFDLHPMVQMAHMRTLFFHFGAISSKMTVNFYYLSRKFYLALWTLGEVIP